MKKESVHLSENDREALRMIVSKTSETVTRHRRATYLLALDSGRTNTSITDEYGVSFPTLRRLSLNYKERGLACLDDKPRSGRPAEIDGEQRAKLTMLACSTPPEGYTRWSLRLLADKSVELGYCEHMSHNHAGTILKKTPFNRIGSRPGVLG